jgi:hypothetical protein
VKSRNAVAAYSWGLLISLLLSIAGGAYTLWAVFKKPSQGDYLTCLAGARDELSKALCGNQSGLYKGIFVASYIVIWLFMICEYLPWLSIHRLIHDPIRRIRYCR